MNDDQRFADEQSESVGLNEMYLESVARDNGRRDSQSAIALIDNLACPPFRTSLDCSTPATSLKVHNYKNIMTNGIDELKHSSGIMVKNYLLYHVTYMNKEGEKVSGPSMILIDPNGRGTKIGSYYLIKQILEFFRDYGFPPYMEPIKMRCEDVVLENGNRTYQLLLGD